MARYQLLLPKMGESVAEATIIKWVKNPGDYIEADDAVIEIATDKVDSEVPSPVSGKLLEQLCKEDEVVQVGAVVAIIETDDVDDELNEISETVSDTPTASAEDAPQLVVAEDKPEVYFTPPTVLTQPGRDAAEIEEQEELAEEINEHPNVVAQVDALTPAAAPTEEIKSADTPTHEPIPGTELLDKNQFAPQRSLNDAPRFYSPLVKHIAFQERLSNTELDSIKGSGSEGRLTKDDLLNYLRERSAKAVQPEVEAAETTESIPSSPPVKAHEVEKVDATEQPEATIPVAEAAVEKIVGPEKEKSVPAPAATVSASGADEIIEMDRMRRLIADHMVMSKHTSPHVTSFVEADVTGLVLWREKIKNSFEKREGEKITFTPIFIEAVVKAIKDFPLINSSVNGTQIIKKAAINISMATALPNGNLIVPVIKKADELNLLGLTKAVNGLATKARLSKLQPDDVKDGTFTITNVGTFGNLMGTPIINQPQVAILAIGAIKKKPAVIETAEGDVIAIRHMMFLSLSYDHRVVDGSLGGSFVKRVADYLENWDFNREV